MKPSEKLPKKILKISMVKLHDIVKKEMKRRKNSVG